MAEIIAAGFTSAAEGYEDEPLNLQAWLVTHPAATFFYRVRGDALRHEYIRDGSILVVDRSLTPERGRLVVTEERDEFVVRRFTGDTGAVVCGVVIWDSKAADVADLLKPFAADRMEAWKVSLRVNSPKNNTPDLSAKLNE